MASSEIDTQDGSSIVKDSEPEMAAASKSPRLSQHSLSLSGASDLADLIAKARSDFSQTLREDMRRYDSPRTRKLPDVNENTIHSVTIHKDKMENEGPKTNGASRTGLKLNLTSTSLDSAEVTTDGAPKSDAGEMSPTRHHSDSRLRSSSSSSSSPRLNEINALMTGNHAAPKAIENTTKKNGSPRLTEINAVLNGRPISPRFSTETKLSGCDDEVFDEQKEEKDGKDKKIDKVGKGDKDEKPNYAELQNKVEKQDDEILVLKTALANVVRRLETLEAERKQRGGVLANGGRSVVPAAAILPSQPRTPMKSMRDSIEDETEQITTEKEKASSARKPLTRRATDTPKKTPPSPLSSPMGPQLTSSSDRRRGSLSRRSTTENLRRSGSLSNLGSSVDTTPKDEIVKFYIRGRAVSTYPPTNFVEPKKNGQIPSKDLKLEWVYGYRGRDCRNNLLVLPTGEIVYHIAAVVILMDRVTGEQRHYLGHNDDIKCIALHPGQVIVASGQVAGHSKEEGKPHVRIWDSKTLETLQVIGLGYFERALCCLSFSIKDGGKMLIAVDEANEHVISLWDWEKNSRYSDNKGSNDPVFGAVFHPNNVTSLVSYGKSHIAFWTINEDQKLVKKMGLFEKHGKPKFVLCAAFTSNGDLLTGDSNGNFLVWGQGTNRITKAIKDAHDGAIFSICCMSDGKILTGGGKERKVMEWNQFLQKTGQEVEIPENAGQVRAITEGLMQDDDTMEIIVGTTKNCILDGSITSGLGFAIQGHVDELWGLATHPSKEMFVTCGTDEKVFLWDSEGHDVMWAKQLKEPAQSAAFHPTAPVLAIGMKSGRWIILDTDTSDEVAAFHDGPEQHDAIKYSPDGKYIAVGSHDNFIYIYNVSEDGKTYKKAGKLSGHSSFVTHLDWAKDSQHMQSNSGDYEILYWHAPTCRQIVSAASMKDMEWETWTCVLGFPVIGIWPEGADGTDINACCRSNNQEYVVTGDDFGQVNLFNYPSTKPKAECRNCIAHSSHVTCVRFMYDDTRMISVGGKDCSVMQWRIT